jgi:hypothetical protein
VCGRLTNEEVCLLRLKLIMTDKTCLAEVAIVVVVIVVVVADGVFSPKGRKEVKRAIS